MKNGANGGRKKADMMFDAKTLKLIADLYDALNKYDPDARAFIAKAYEMAMRAHAGQKRDGGEAYINHPIRVAITLVRDFGVKDPDCVAAAFLHDALEDTPLGYAEIEMALNKRVADYVKVLTKPPKVEGMAREKYLDDYFGGIKNGLPAVKMLKVADRLDNLADMMAENKARLKRYVEETDKYIMPIAKDVSPEATYRVYNAVLAALGVLTAAGK